MARSKDKRLIIGLMSGTSVDAVDAALVEVRTVEPGRYSAKVVHHVEWPWLPDIRRRLLAAMAPARTTTQEICELNVAVAEAFGCAALECVRRAGYRESDIAAIGSHGQTICHLPRGEISKLTYPSTLQIGDVSVIATLTEITTVGNFRPADIFMGGQGAPLVPWADEMLLSDDRITRAVQNIGGIGNVTYLPALEKEENWVRAFDTGPGNMVMDAVVAIATKGREQFDRNGKRARRGMLVMNLFRDLQKHPYFERQPPKSAGRESFGQTFAAGVWKKWRKHGLDHVLCTLTRWTAWSIADAYLQFLPELPDEVIVCGGGADNPVLMRMLREEFAGLTSEFTRPEPPRLRRIEEFGIPNKAKEAASFALLAAATLDGVPANLPSVTGAERPVVLGVIARP